MKNYGIILLLGLLVARLQAQELVPNEFLLMFVSQEASTAYFAAKSDKIQALKQLSQRPCIYKVRAQEKPETLLPSLLQDKRIRLAQPNHYARWRTLPNDPKYAQWQWALDTIGAPLAWDYTTGGVSPNGDTIVVAVIDGGCDMQHPDLQANLWKNCHEIPDNNLDDDGNGWIDDRNGWNIVAGNDDHQANSHGTSVASIIGAAGNNGVGMAGVNWQVKLMLLSGGEQEMIEEANIVEAYSYVLEMRRRYNQTNGQQGAFVVCTNASLGIDGGNPADYPIWAAIYDSLGNEGVISAAATANAAVNVDVVGDMPTACESDFLLAVTQSTQENELHPVAAFGTKSVDLAAPGAVYAARPNNTYNVFGGTSGASPHAAGAVALLYAYPNARWAALQREKPDAAARLVKQLLLENVSKHAAFEDNTAAGGVLNIGRAMERLAEYFSEPENTEILAFYPNPAKEWITVKCAFEAAGKYKLELVDMLGRKCWEQPIQASQAEIQYLSVFVGDLGQGLYVLRLSDGKRRWTGRFVKA